MFVCLRLLFRVSEFKLYITRNVSMRHAPQNLWATDIRTRVNLYVPYSGGALIFKNVD